MGKAFDRIKGGLDDIEKWKAGRTKATVWFNGEPHRMTYSQHKFLLLGQKGAINAGVRVGLERAEKAVRDCPSLDSNGYVCEKAAAIEAIRAQGE